MIDRRLVQYFDWWLLCLIMAIAACGLVALSSAVKFGTDSDMAILFTRQLAWYGMGFGALVITFLFNYKYYERYSYLIYIACILMLVGVLLFGKHVAGSRRWLGIGPFSIQPSEMVKLAVILVVARYYTRIVRDEGITLRELVWPALLTAIPFILIVKQPDLGTAMMVFLIVASMTLYIKIERRTLILLVTGGSMMIPIVWTFLKGYQKQRILTFLNPERDPLGTGYHIIQSKIAIGSGMLTGKGYFKGSQNTLEFLPEQHTDFIFSVLAEEWGLIGGFLLITLFLLIILYALQIAQRSRDPFGTIMVVGVTAMMAWQVFINAGMVMGLLPVVGVTLPFISYGGSSVITIMAGMGLLLNVSMRRFMFEH
jgi:rod shape determining protein RodA